jgi:hypothetical protein
MPKFRISLHAIVALIWAGFLVLVSTTTRKPTAQGSIGAATPAVFDPPADAEILNAADKELLSSPKTPDSPAPKLQFTREGAQQAAETASVFLSIIW